MTPCSRSRSGSTWTCSIWSRSPQIATFATPGTRSSRAPDGPVGDHRHVDEATRVRRQPDLHDAAGRRQRLHHERRARPRRQRGGDPARCAPATCWRAISRSVPGSKISFDRRQLRHRLGAQDRRGPGTPASACSIGIGDQRLDLGRGQAEAGRLDLDHRRRELREHVDPVSRSWSAPNSISARPRATTMKRNLRLDPTIHATWLAVPVVISASVTSDRRRRRSRRRTARRHRG